VRLGGDPQAERRARAAAATAREARALTVRRLVERYLTELQAGRALSRRLKGRTIGVEYFAEIRRQLGRFATRHGSRAATAISRAEVVSLLDDYVGQPSVHRRMRDAIGRMYAWARREELVSVNPTAEIDTAAAVARERVLTLEELAAIWAAASLLGPLYRDVIRLLILTGQRRTEVAGMRWREVDLTAALWTIPSGRTKARRQHVVPLAVTAQAILRARQQGAADDLVLPVASRDGRRIVPVTGWTWLKAELDQRSGVADWRLHDFRRSLVTIMADRAGADIAVLDSLLNHAASATRGGVIGVYQRAILIEPMRKLMAGWDELISQAVSQVVSLTGKQRVKHRQRRHG
jgi:integrase